jgi:hypothetical protein
MGYGDSALDLSNHQSPNGSCIMYAGLWLGSHIIGCIRLECKILCHRLYLYHNILLLRAILGLLIMFQQGQIRTTYNIDGSTTGDCLQAYFCPNCTVMQHDREVRARELEMLEGRRRASVISQPSRGPTMEYSPFVQGNSSTSHLYQSRLGSVFALPGSNIPSVIPVDVLVNQMAVGEGRAAETHDLNTLFDGHGGHRQHKDRALIRSSSPLGAGLRQIVRSSSADLGRRLTVEFQPQRRATNPSLRRMPQSPPSRFSSLGWQDQGRRHHVINESAESANAPCNKVGASLEHQSSQDAPLLNANQGSQPKESQNIQTDCLGDELIMVYYDKQDAPQRHRLSAFSRTQGSISEVAESDNHDSSPNHSKTGSLICSKENGQTQKVKSPHDETGGTRVTNSGDEQKFEQLHTSMNQSPSNGELNPYGDSIGGSTSPSTSPQTMSTEFLDAPESPYESSDENLDNEMTEPCEENEKPALLRIDEIIWPYHTAKIDAVTSPNIQATDALPSVIKEWADVLLKEVTSDDMAQSLKTINTDCCISTITSRNQNNIPNNDGQNQSPMSEKEIASFDSGCWGALEAPHVVDEPAITDIDGEKAVSGIFATPVGVGHSSEFVGIASITSILMAQSIPRDGVDMHHVLEDAVIGNRGETGTLPFENMVRVNHVAENDKIINESAYTRTAVSIEVLEDSENTTENVASQAPLPDTDILAVEPSRKHPQTVHLSDSEDELASVSRCVLAPIFEDVSSKEVVKVIAKDTEINSFIKSEDALVNSNGSQSATSKVKEWTLETRISEFVHPAPDKVDIEAPHETQDTINGFVDTPVYGISLKASDGLLPRKQCAEKANLSTDIGSLKSTHSANAANRAIFVSGLDVVDPIPYDESSSEQSSQTSITRIQSLSRSVKLL